MCSFMGLCVILILYLFTLIKETKNFKDIKNLLFLPKHYK